MSADPKPPRRIVDPDTLRKFVQLGQRCLVCGQKNAVDAHHVLRRSKGGDDLFENLVPLCRRCHGAYHGNQYINDWGIIVNAGVVRFKTARWLETDDGRETRAYLVGKLGKAAADVYLKREFGIQSGVINDWSNG